NQKIAEQLRMLSRLIGEHIDIVWQPCEIPLPVQMDPSQLTQILTNLTINARDAIGDSGKMTIETSLASITEPMMFNKNDLQPGQYAVLSVTDNGRGISPENLTRVFEPFFTTKPVGKGSGLGLSTVYGIIRQCSGHIHVYSEKRRGTTFRMYFHLCSEIATHQEHTPAKEPGTLCHETVLLVEDERALLAFVKKLLEQMGYNVLSAHGPQEALKIESDYTGDVHLLLTDVIMPEMNGPQLADILHRKRPSMKVVFMSGYTANAITHQKILAKDTAFLSKPFSSSDLWFALRKVLDVPAASPAGQSSGHNPVS
ncbi:MAG: ATP-binding protein, partial [Kiritimatiellae bacterium]|nr:ATP-binding protein [Kiritimatiellia bacterium]